MSEGKLGAEQEYKSIINMQKVIEKCQKVGGSSFGEERFLGEITKDEKIIRVRVAFLEHICLSFELVFEAKT